MFDVLDLLLGVRVRVRVRVRVGFAPEFAPGEGCGWLYYMVVGTL